MSLVPDGPNAWRWIDVYVPSVVLTYCPRFRYRDTFWVLECSEYLDGEIRLNLIPCFIPPRHPRFFSPLSISLTVFRGQDACFEGTYIVDDDDLRLPRKLLWQRRTSDMEQIFPGFLQDRLLTFMIQLTEQDPQRGLSQWRRPIGTNLSAQPQMHFKTFTDASVQTSLTADSISCLDALSADIGKMLDAESEKDLEIQCDGQTTRAHKSVLCSRSPVFARMLQSNMLEGNTGMVNVRDMDMDTLHKFLNYLYTGRFDEALTLEAAVLLYEAADMYAVESLSRRCSQFLLQNMTGVNACNLLAVADAHGDGDFKRMITRYILQEKIPLSGERWQDFCKSHPSLAREVSNQYVELLTDSEGPSKKQRVEIEKQL